MGAIPLIVLDWFPGQLDVINQCICPRMWAFNQNTSNTHYSIGFYKLQWNPLMHLYLLLLSVQIF